MSPIVPTAPTSIGTLFTTSTSANITWQAPIPFFDTPISVIEHYELMVYEYQFNISTIHVTTAELYYLFTNLEEFNNYTCEIAAVNRVGQGVYSSPYNFSTLQAGM